MAEARVILHLPRRHLADFPTIGHLRIFARIMAALTPMGAQIEVRDRRLAPFEGGDTASYADGNLHIIENGRVRAPGVLNTTMAYLPPFWHLDAQGVLAESSIGGRVYVPGPVQPAMGFFRDLRAKWVVPRRSRHSQAAPGDAVPEGAIAVFMQGGLPQDRGLAYCSAAAMLRAVAAGANGRAVLAKPHPLALAADRRIIAQVRAEGHAIAETGANLHDLLEAAAVSVSFNSAVALEGFLHRTPAILFGPSDFHHFAETVRDPAEFPLALSRALARPEAGYAQFLHWYFRGQCLNVEGRDFPAQLLSRFAAMGFPAEKLGLNSASQDPDSGG
jgi:hypothetical protein